MIDVFGNVRSQIEKTVFGLASPFIFQALVKLTDDACKCYVPEVNLETAIDLCIPAHQKQTLLNIKKIAVGYIASNPYYRLELAAFEGYRLQLRVGSGLDIPLSPDAPGPASSCNIEKYVALQENIQAWVSLSRRMSMGYWLLRYYNDNGILYSQGNLRYLFHCLPALFARALPIADITVQAAELEVTNAWKNKAEKIANLSMAKAGREQLRKLRKLLGTHHHRHTISVSPEHRIEVVNLNNSVAECLVLESNAPNKAPDLPMYLSADASNFHPFFLDQAVSMIGLDPFDI